MTTKEQRSNPKPKHTPKLGKGSGGLNGECQSMAAGMDKLVFKTLASLQPPREIFTWGRRDRRFNHHRGGRGRRMNGRRKHSRRPAT